MLAIQVLIERTGNYKNKGNCNQIQKIIGKLVFSAKIGFKEIMMTGILAK